MTNMVMSKGDLRLITLMLLCLSAACTTTDKTASTPLIEEDKLYVTRVFVGQFVDYRHTLPDKFGNPDLIWLTTTLDSIHGRISAFSEECNFRQGERLYLRRMLTTMGREKAWIFTVENESTVSYRVNEYHNHSNPIVDNIFNSERDTISPFYFVAPQRLAQETSGGSDRSSGSN